MSTKETGNNKGNPTEEDNKGSFDDFAESFFSTQIGTSVNRLSRQSDTDEEDSSEDFGIAGDVDTIDMPLMPLDDGEDKTAHKTRMAEFGSLSARAKIAIKFSPSAYLLFARQMRHFASSCKFANLTQYTRSLKSVLVLLPRILGPIGPPKNA